MDAPEAGPIEAALRARGWGLDLILITHHHGDHIAGVDALREAYGAKVVGAAADRRRLPALDVALKDGDTVALGESVARGHRGAGPHGRAHRLLLRRGGGALLGRQPDGDGLRAAVRGNARADVGEPQHAWRRCRTTTLVYSGHEYAESNAALRAVGRRREPRAGASARATSPRRARRAGRRCRRGSTSSGRRTPSCAPPTRRSRRGSGWRICPMPKFSPRSAGARMLSEQGRAIDAPSHAHHCNIFCAFAICSRHNRP